MKTTAHLNTDQTLGREKDVNPFQVFSGWLVSLNEDGPRARPLERRKLSRNARRLIKRILAATTDENPIWSEGNEDVANALRVNRSTVIRIVKRLRLIGILQPVDTTGGRGRVSQYLVNRRKAQALLRSGYWEASEEIEARKLVEKKAQEHVQANKPVQKAPAERFPSLLTQAGRQHAPTRIQAPYDAPLQVGLLDWALLDWLAGKASAVAELVKRFLGDPMNRRLIRHLALFAGICTVGSWGIYKIWTIKGKRRL